MKSRSLSSVLIFALGLVSGVGQTHYLDQLRRTNAIHSGDLFLTDVNIGGTNYVTRAIYWSNLVAGLNGTNTGGTVTSVGLNTLPAQFGSNSGPITANGSLGFSNVFQSANTFLAGPTTGSAANPSYRGLVAADLPAGFGDQVWTNENGFTVQKTLTNVIVIGTNQAGWNATSLTEPKVYGEFSGDRAGNEPKVMFRELASGSVNPIGLQYDYVNSGFGGKSPQAILGSMNLPVNGASGIAEYNDSPAGVVGSLSFGGGLTNGEAAGVCGVAVASYTTTIGVVGLSVGNLNSQTNIGVAGHAMGYDSSGVRVGGFFQTSLSSGIVSSTKETATLLLDNRDSRDSLIVGRTNNGSTVFKVDTFGAVSLSAQTNRYTDDGTQLLRDGVPVGTVTSVGLNTLPAQFGTNSGPITSSGSLGFTNVFQSANQVLAGPTTGSAANPSYRALVTADLPATVAANTVSATSNNAGSITLTNQFTAKIGTWSGPTNSVDLSVFRQQYTTTTAMAVTNFLNASAAGYETSCVLSVTNSSGSDVILYLTGTITTDDGARNYTITNHTQRKFSFNCDDMGYHCVSRTFF